MGSSEVSTSVVRWSEGHSSRVSTILRIYIDHMIAAVYMAVSIITFFFFFLDPFCFIVYLVVCFVYFCLIL
jgi:hypothetical protein